MVFEKDAHAFIVESNRFVREVVIVARSGDFYTVRFVDSGGGIKLRGSRLFESKEEAEASMRKADTPKPTGGYRSPYDYMH